MRKFLIALGLLGLLCLTSPESASTATINVDSSTGDDGTGDGNANPFFTIAHAIGAASSGDVIKLAASPVPYDAIDVTGLTAGTSFHDVTFLGDSTAPNKVIVPGMNVDAYGYVHALLTNIVVNGIRFTAPVTVTQDNQYLVTYSETTHCSAAGFHIRNCVMVQGYTIDNVAPRIQACRVGTDSSSASARIRCTTGYSGNQIIGATLIDNVFKLRTTDAASDYLFSLQSELYNAGEVPIEGTILTRNKLTFTLTTAIAKSTLCHGVRGTVSTDNKWTYNDSLPPGSGTQGFLWRDALQNNTFRRDTLICHAARTGANSLWAQLIGSGNNDQAHLADDGYANVWTNCYFKSDMARTDYGSFFVYKFWPRDSFAYNVVACSTGVAMPALFINGAGGGNTGGPYVGHNTFFNKGLGGAVWMRAYADLDCASSWVGPLTFKDNILYTGSTSTGSSGYALNLKLRNDYAVWSDYNLFAHYGGSGSRSVLAGYCTGTQATRTVGENGSRCATQGRDCNSLYGSPMFVDSLWANFTGIIDTTTSAAFHAGSNGSDIGAKSSGAGDVTAPSAVSDLTAILATSGSVQLQWTAPGDNAATGTAAGYDLRYSHALITSGNFGSALSVSTAAPAVAGTVTTATVYGLGAGTTYYFALKTRDKEGNTSAISNVVSARTTTYGGTSTTTP